MSGHIHLRSFWNCQSCGFEPSLDTVRPVSQLLQLYTPATTVALFAQVLRSHPLSLVVLGCVSIPASLAPSLGSSPLSPHCSRVHTCLSETDPLGGDRPKRLTIGSQTLLESRSDIRRTCSDEGELPEISVIGLVMAILSPLKRLSPGLKILQGHDGPVCPARTQVAARRRSVECHLTG